MEHSPADATGFALPEGTGTDAAPAPETAVDRPGPARRPGRVLLIVLASLLALVMLGGGCFAAARRLIGAFTSASAAASAAGEQILLRVQDGAYAQLWQEAAPEFREALSEDGFIRFMHQVDGTVGRPQTWSMTGFNSRVFAGTGGMRRRITADYRVEHTRGATAVTLTMDGDGRLLHINFNFVD